MPVRIGCGKSARIVAISNALSPDGLSLNATLRYGTCLKKKGCIIAYEGKVAGDAEASREKAHELVANLEPDARRALELIVDGHSLIRIAGELSVSVEDAVRLKASLIQKLGARTTADLVRVGLYAQVGADR